MHLPQNHVREFVSKLYWCTQIPASRLLAAFGLFDTFSFRRSILRYNPKIFWKTRKISGQLVSKAGTSHARNRTANHYTAKFCAIRPRGSRTMVWKPRAYHRSLGFRILHKFVSRRTAWRLQGACTMQWAKSYELGQGYVQGLHPSHCTALGSRCTTRCSESSDLSSHF